MTALVTGIGLVPLALGAGEPGKEIQQPMAVVTLGGIVTSTVLHMLVVPALYARFARGVGVSRWRLTSLWRTGTSAPMGRARVVAVLVCLAVLPVSPLAFATPIDPSHPGGFYDNGDLDDVIEFLCGCAATITPVLSPLEPWWIVVASVCDHEGPTFDPACRWTPATRAPPNVLPPAL